MKRARFPNPWVRVGILTFLLTSVALVYSSWGNAGPWLGWGHNDEGDAQILLQVSYPVVLVLFSPLLVFGWRKRGWILAHHSDRDVGMTLIAISLILLFWFDGFQIRRRREVQEKAVLDTSLVYWSQGQTETSIKTLTDALAQDPRQAHLAIRLAWTLAKTHQHEEARRWLEIVDKMEIPPYLIPAVQETRLALLEK